MNRPILLAATIAVIALVGAGSAFAVEATQDDASAPSGATRADVQRAAHDVSRYDEASLLPQPASALPRAQVVAETQEALRLGLIGGNAEAAHPASAAQMEQIHLAGERAVSNPSTHGAE